MGFDARAIFANLAEKERIKGHHSPEGSAIRTLSRALHGWSSGNLAAGDVVVLCNQAVEDWLKVRLRISAWAAIGFMELVAAAVQSGVLAPAEADSLRLIHEMRRNAPGAAFTAAEAENALQHCIEIIEERWE